jgi:hypothetical protein
MSGENSRCSYISRTLHPDDLNRGGPTRTIQHPKKRTAEKLCGYTRYVNPMRIHATRFLYALVLLLATAYGYDFASVRRRVSAQKPGDPFDVVTYPHILAIPQKGNKVDYELDAQSPMESDPCIHSLFPHYGYTPCWYVLRKSKSFTQMTIVFPALL